MKNNDFKDNFLVLVGKISKDKQLLDKFFGLFLSPREYREIIVRLQIIKMISEGRAQRQIKNKLGISIATVSRGAREFQGQKEIFKKIFKHAQKTFKNKG